MTDIDREERIRTRAHQIWERQGQPEGRQEEHWDQARREIEMEDEDAAGLQRTLTETIGLAVGVEPDEGRRAAEGDFQPEPAEGDRGTVERELSRSKRAAPQARTGRSGKSTRSS